MVALLDDCVLYTGNIIHATRERAEFQKASRIEMAMIDVYQSGTIVESSKVFMVMASGTRGASPKRGEPGLFPLRAPATLQTSDYTYPPNLIETSHRRQFVH